MKKIVFYPIDITYKTENDKPVIYIFGRLVDGKQICVRDENFVPYFYVVSSKNIEDKLKKIKITKGKHVVDVLKTEKVKKRILGKEGSAMTV